MIKKLNIKTVTKKQLGNALVYVGKLLMNNDYNTNTVKMIREKFTKFINNLKKQRQDLCVVKHHDIDSDFNNPQRQYNHIVSGRGFFNCGMTLLHPSGNDLSPDSFNTTEDKLIELSFPTDIMLVNRKQYNQITASLKNGKSFFEINDTITTKISRKIDKSTPDYNPDVDEEMDDAVLSELDEATEDLDANCNFANKYGKTKEQKNKLFLQGLFIK